MTEHVAVTEAEATVPPADQIQIATLMTAQIGMLLTELRRTRADLTAQIAGLHGQGASGDPQIDKIRTFLNTQMSGSLTAIDALIAEAETAARGPNADTAAA